MDSMLTALFCVRQLFNNAPGGLLGPEEGKLCERPTAVRPKTGRFSLFGCYLPLSFLPTPLWLCSPSCLAGPAGWEH